MNSSANILQAILPNLFFVIAQLIVLCACFIYASRAKSTDAMLMVTGSLINLFASMVSMAFTAALVLGNNSGNHQNFSIYSLVITVSHMMGCILFAAGMIMMALRTPPAGGPGERDNPSRR